MTSGSRKEGCRPAAILLLAGILSWSCASGPDPGAEPEISSSQGASPADSGDGAGARFEEVSWELLGGYEYELPLPSEVEAWTEEELKAREGLLPDEVMELDGRRVALTGFLTPVLYDSSDGRVTDAVLSLENHLGCGFGMADIRMNEWVHVSLPKKGLGHWSTWQPTTVHGTLSVGEIWQDGWLLSLYRLDLVEFGQS